MDSIALSAKGALTRAVEWISLGQPVLVAKRNPAWSPEMPGREFLFPRNWQSVTAEECDLSNYEPGDALIAPCGWTFDVIDIDTKLGEAVSRSSVPPEIETFGEHLTPSGGSHLFVKKLGYSKNNTLRFGGVHVGDYLAGTDAGAGRAFVYLPGTARPRYGGAGYTVVQEVDLEKLIDSFPDPVLESVVMACGSSRSSDVGRPPADSTQLAEFRESFQYQVPTCGYGRAAIEGMLSADVPVGTRHTWFVRSMLRVVELIKSGCCGTQDITALSARLQKVMPEGGTSPDEVLRYAIANTKPLKSSGCSIHTGKGPVLLDMSDPVVKERSKRHGELVWSEFWQRGEDTHQPDLIHGFLPSGKSATVFSRAGAGKSLLMLEWAVKVARGEELLGYRSIPRVVIYLDQENPEDTLRERLEAMGYGPEDDLSNLRYYLYGEWPPLNTVEGADALMGEVMAVGADVVVVDTLSKFVAGDENESATYLDLNRQIGVRLRRADVAFVRLDHSGKDVERGTRGSSAKQADVDVEYSLSVGVVDPVTGACPVVLKRTKDRLGLGEETLTLDRYIDPVLRHEVRDTSEQMRKRAEIDLLIAELDAMGVPVTAGRPTIKKALMSAGKGRSSALLNEAVKVRKARADLLRISNGE